MLAIVGALQGRSPADEYGQVLGEVYDRVMAYLTLWPRPQKGSDPIFAPTVCYGRGGNVVTLAGLLLSTRAIHHIINGNYCC